MRFLIDTQLPRALAEFLIRQGHSAEHVLDIDMAKAKDSDIRSYALKTAAVIVSKDEDFTLMHHQDGEGPQVVWLRCGNVRNAKLIEGIGRALPAVIAELERDVVIVEVQFD